MGKGKGYVPFRTCVSCGARRSKHDLVRFVLDPDGRPVRDEALRMEGRGAYTCKTQRCGDGLKNANKIFRAFRRPSNKGLLGGSPRSKHIGGFNGKSQGL